MQWLPPYLARLQSTGISNASLRVVELDAEYIVKRCILGAGIPGADGSSWSEHRLRRGLIVGSVQSGKTASMLAVAAKAMDSGVDVIVLLTGTRTALWRQTVERTLEQLDGWTSELDTPLRARRVMVPQPRVMMDQVNRPSLADLYFETPNVVRRRLIEGKPLVAMVMKHSDHLIQFGRWMRQVLTHSFISVQRPVHALIIDDEADDGSILDAIVEAGLGADSDRLKQIPRHVAQLWSGSGCNHETFHKQLFATYIAYTATPQANVLQSDHNPLAPTDFVVALRTPFDSGPIEPPRESTYEEPAGLFAYYMGGELFYRKFSDGLGSLLITARFPERRNYADNPTHDRAVELERRQQVTSALRGYFVAVASHLLLTKRSIAGARALEYGTAAEVSSLCPSPLCALIHPSSLQDDHLRMAELIVAWSCGLDLDRFDSDQLPHDSSGRLMLSVDGLIAKLESEEELWTRWIAEYEATRHRLATFTGGGPLPPITANLWEDLKRLLRAEVFPHIKLSIINASPDADDRPQFKATRHEDGGFRVPEDVFTIFISGNVMSRGVTIEGLVSTVFLRSSNLPAADTQMQMQRWFGYRGTKLRWCRVFMFEDQLQLFRAYHEADESMRREIIEEMNRVGDGAPSPMILQENSFRATAKVSNIRSLPLCPGADPFIRVLEHGPFAEQNANILAQLLNNEQWEQLVVNGLCRGIVMRDRQFSLLEVAELLDKFRYSQHDPDRELPQHDRWRALQSSLGLSGPLFCPPGHLAVKMDAVSPPHCPYSIAAYLRLWQAVVSRRARGLYPTDDRQTPWSFLDLTKNAQTVPRFYIGVRYGPEGLSTHPALSAFGIKRMIRRTENGVAIATWGSRNPSTGPDMYLGDQLFDYHVHGRRPPVPVPGEPNWRPRGEPGLLLFHILKEFNGQQDAVTAGLILPLGGPDHFAALRPAASLR